MKFIDITEIELSESDDLYMFEDIDEYIEIKSAAGVNDCVIAPAVAFRIVRSGLIVIEGDYCSCNEETKQCEPDWTISLVYEDVEDEEFDPERWLYFEQGTAWSAVHNYKRYTEN
jgi:hypothetical protein